MAGVRQAEHPARPEGGDSGTGPVIEAVEAGAFTIPTDHPESDATLRWDATTVVVAEAQAGGQRGLGYTYADASVARLVGSQLAPAVIGQDALAVPARWRDMQDSVRNLGHTGLTQMAIAAVDTALWDLKARLLDLSLVTLLGRWRDEVPVYGSGGFTSYRVERLQEQMAGWVAAGIPRVKMKVGRSPQSDPGRIQAVRRAIGDDAELFVDANGAFMPRQAVEFGRRVVDAGVSWFEEPVTSDDLPGLKFVRDRGPEKMEVTAGEYGFSLEYFERMLEAGAVDVIQPDVTRCGGVTGFQRVAALCRAHHTELSAHTAPQLDAHVGACVEALRHVEYFHDHVRVEQRIFDGTLEPVAGSLKPDRSRPGMGLTLKRRDAGRWLVDASPGWET